MELWHRRRHAGLSFLELLLLHDRPGRLAVHHRETPRLLELSRKRVPKDLSGSRVDTSPSIEVCKHDSDRWRCSDRRGAAANQKEEREAYNAKNKFHESFPSAISVSSEEVCLPSQAGGEAEKSPGESSRDSRDSPSALLRTCQSQQSSADRAQCSALKPFPCCPRDKEAYISGS